MRTPRPRSQLRSAPATTASTTSLTVPPNASLIDLEVGQARRAPSGSGGAGRSRVLSGSLGAGFISSQATSPTPSAVSASVRGCTGADAAARRAPACRGRSASSPGPRPRARSARRRRARGAAPTGAPGGVRPTGTGFASNSTVARSTPETPSTSAWWVLLISAKRFPSSPCTRYISHSGFERSSCCEKTRAVSCASWSSSPGSGSEEWRTWYSRFSRGSSIQNGRPALQRREGELLPVARHEVQPRLDVLEELVVDRRRALEDEHGADVHVRRLVLLGEEAGVGRAQPVEVGNGHGSARFPFGIGQPAPRLAI